MTLSRSLLPTALGVVVAATATTGALSAQNQTSCCPQHVTGAQLRAAVATTLPVWFQTPQVANASTMGITQIAVFPPNTPPTYASPAGAQPGVEYSMCTGHSDPATGVEYAVAPCGTALTAEQVSAVKAALQKVGAL